MPKLKQLTREELIELRARMIQTYSVCQLFNDFVGDDSKRIHEIYIPDENTVLDDGRRFGNIQPPMKVYHEIYELAVRGRWHGNEFKVQKRGSVVVLNKDWQV